MPSSPVTQYPSRCKGRPRPVAPRALLTSLVVAGLIFSSSVRSPATAEVPGGDGSEDFGLITLDAAADLTGVEQDAETVEEAAGDASPESAALEPLPEGTPVYRVVVVHSADVAGQLAAAAYTTSIGIPLLVLDDVRSKENTARIGASSPEDIFVVGGEEYFPDVDIRKLSRFINPTGPAESPILDSSAPFGLRRIHIEGEPSDVSVAELLTSSLRPRAAIVVSAADANDPATAEQATDVAASAGVPVYVQSPDDSTEASLARSNLNGLITDLTDQSLIDAVSEATFSEAVMEEGLTPDLTVEGLAELDTRSEGVAPRDGVEVGSLREEELFWRIEPGEPAEPTRGGATAEGLTNGPDCQFNQMLHTTGFDEAATVTVEVLAVNFDSCERLVEFNVSTRAYEETLTNSVENETMEVAPTDVNRPETMSLSFSAAPNPPAPNRTYLSWSRSTVDEPLIRLCQQFGVSNCPLDPTSVVKPSIKHRPTNPPTCANASFTYYYRSYLRVPGLSIWEEDRWVPDSSFACASSWAKIHAKYINTAFLFQFVCSSAPNTVAHHWPTYVRAVPNGLTEHTRNTTFSGRCVAEGFLSKGWSFGQGLA